MKHLIEKTIESLPNLDSSQIQNLVSILAAEVKEIELLELALSSLPIGIIVAKPNHKIQFINIPAKRFIPLKKRSEEQLIWEAILDEDISSFVKESLEKNDNGTPKEFTIERLGHEKILSVGLFPVVKKGRICGDFLYIEDVTLKRAEEARLRRAESLASLTTLAAGVAHEIKNPLGSISIHLQLMDRLLSCENEACKEELKEYVSIISEEVERLNSIVVDYLFAVRPIDTNPKPADLNALIKELISFMQYELNECQITLVSQLDPNLPLIKLDEKLMKQALLNIVKNAIAAMPKGGTFRVQTLVKNDQVILKMIDSGQGIDEENLKKIFEPYFTTKDSGSGLGLTLVYKVIKEHGGDIVVSSKKNQGTAFSMTFPIPQSECKLLSWGGTDEI